MIKITTTLLLVLFTFSINASDEYCSTASENGKKFSIYYKKKDLKKQKKLCSLEFFNETNYLNHKEEHYQTAICPKLVNTSPAIEVYRLPITTDRDHFIRTQCPLKKREAKKLAKYKLSTSCSYTPSILTYYHFSRLLGIGKVPVAVKKMIDRKKHIQIAEKGVQYSKKLHGWMPKNWVSLLKKLKTNNHNVVDREKDFSYGALVDNPRGEQLYSAFYGDGVKGYYKTRLYRTLKKRGSISKILSKSFKNIGKIFQLKDYSDMLIFDALLSQFDRYGNVSHVKDYYYKEDGHLKHERLNPKSIEQKEKMKSLNAILVKRMLLKDNDCGLIFRNRVLDDRALEKIRHVSNSTYEALNNLHQLFQNSEFKTWLTQELLLTPRDISKISSNLNKILSILSKGIQSGKVLLDLNPEEY